ncbi:FadR/GntR family transcriptional regulator [Nocardioides sp. Iso805N]|uniref:FadR/GntR family transcriptional regulator n=1 Tax=Nocardioides sp. Iso805N TaxID=1283287 RepID=UPI0003780C42|nr:FCD domain-containing protein [Nocardioides sp. Iso805N]
MRGASRAAEIADRVTEAIHLGLLADGERLPPEAEFAHSLGVAPMTLRESFAFLRERGLVETRRGRNGGTFVRRNLEPPAEPDAARLRSMSVGALRDLADEQIAISATTARLAAERATAHDVRRIEMLAGQLAVATTRGALIKSDSRFHVEIAIATRSERLLRREVALQAESAGMLWLPGPGAETVGAAAAEHLRIAEAIRAESGEAAHAAAIHHARENLRRLAATRQELVEAEGSPA